jgi:hypothetical protein
MKPSIDKIRAAHRVYNEVITQLVLNPKAIVQAYRDLTGSEEALINQQYAHRFVHSFFYHKKYLDIYPNYTLEDVVEEQVQALDFLFELPEKEVDEIEEEVDEKQKLVDRIALLEKELELAQTSEDWKLIKNTKMKITMAKKKLNEHGE